MTSTYFFCGEKTICQKKQLIDYHKSASLGKVNSSIKQENKVAIFENSGKEMVVRW